MPVKTAEMQLGFSVRAEAFVINQFATEIEASGLVNDGLQVQADIIHHHHWPYLPAGGLLLTILNHRERTASWVDVGTDNWQVSGKEIFTRDFKRADIAGAVVVTPFLSSLDSSWLGPDLEVIAENLPDLAGPLFIVEKKPNSVLSYKLDRKWREECLKNPSLELGDIEIYANRDRNYFLWTARRKLEHDQSVWNEVMKYFRAERDLAARVGIHVFESTDGGLQVVNWGSWGEQVSQIGEVNEGEVLKRIGFQARLELPDLSEKGERLKWKLIKQARQEQKDLEKPLLLPGRTILAEQCWDVERHPNNQPVNEQRDAYFLSEKRGRQLMHIETNCPHCGRITEPSAVLVKPHKRWIKGEWVSGWVRR